MSNVISDHDIAHLADQFSNARPILFVGAGFSLDAKNMIGEPCPSFEDVRKGLSRVRLESVVVSAPLVHHAIKYTPIGCAGSAVSKAALSRAISGTGRDHLPELRR